MIHGILNLDKPPKISSFEALKLVKRVLKVKKAGYIGTLDPFATGVLPICLGEATKIIQYIQDQVKEYEAILHLGVRTDTLDENGKVVSVQSSLNLSEARIYEVFESFHGDIEQIPPSFSALKVNGIRAYQLARGGVNVQLAPRSVRIYDLKVQKIELPKVKFWVRCSKGTYVRSLADSIGDELGCGGHLSELRRTKAGDFSLDDSLNLAQLEQNDKIQRFIIPINSALRSIPKVKISQIARRKILNGTLIFLDDLLYIEEEFSDGAVIKVEDESGNLLCMAKALADSKSLSLGQLPKDSPICQPKRVFNLGA